MYSEEGRDYASIAERLAGGSPAAAHHRTAAESDADGEDPLTRAQLAERVEAETGTAVSKKTISRARKALDEA